AFVVIEPGRRLEPPHEAGGPGPPADHLAPRRRQFDPVGRVGRTLPEPADLPGASQANPMAVGWFPVHACQCSAAIAAPTCSRKPQRSALPLLLERTHRCIR